MLKVPCLVLICSHTLEVNVFIGTMSSAHLFTYIRGKCVLKVPCLVLRGKCVLKVHLFTYIRAKCV